MTKIIQKTNFYYLQYSYKKNDKVITYEKYLGKEIPKNIILLQKNFDEECFKKRFENEISKIKKKFEKINLKLPKEAKKKYLEQFTVKFTYNSEAIEGSTLNLKDTIHLIENDISPNKDIKDIINSKKHYEVFLEILESNKDLSINFILEIHKKLFIHTYPNIAGKIRNHNVKIVGSKTVFPTPTKVEDELKEFIKWYKKNNNIINPVRLSALVHLKFVNIHPFTDGNGRVSRILMNYILYKNKFPLLDINYTKRRQYYNALEKSNIKFDENYFVIFITKKFIEENEYIIKN